MSCFSSTLLHSCEERCVVGANGRIQAGTGAQLHSSEIYVVISVSMLYDVVVLLVILMKLESSSLVCNCSLCVCVCGSFTG